MTGPLKPLNLTTEEFDEARRQIAAGELPPDALEQHRKDCAAAVFGHDHKTDRNGEPVEQGVGAKGFESANHFRAIRKAEQDGMEPAGSYDRALAEIWRRDPARAEKLGLPGRK